jgi:hypothetical protein
VAGPLGCDELREVTGALAACAGNLDGNCVDTVCARLGPVSCDDLDEAMRVARACGGG